MNTFYFSSTDVDDPDAPVPDEDHTEDDDNDEDESVVPDDRKGTPVGDAPLAE